MFSEVVDFVIGLTGRRERKQDIARWLNATMRECQNTDYYERDMTEDQITTSAVPHVWPRPRLFRRLRTVYYPSVDSWPRYYPPGNKLRERPDDYYYYGNSTSYVFNGLAAGTNIDLAYYSKTRYFQYYEEAARPAVYDREADTWSYLQNGSYVATLGSTTLDEAAQVLVSNWLLDEWEYVLQEGTLAKLFKAIESARATSSFALYKSHQKDIMAGEVSH